MPRRSAVPMFPAPITAIFLATISALSPGDYDRVLTSQAAFHRERQGEAGDGLGAEELRHGRDDVDRQVLALARGVRLRDEARRSPRPCSQAKWTSASARLKNSALHVLEDDGDPPAGGPRRLEARSERRRGVGARCRARRSTSSGGDCACATTAAERSRSARGQVDDARPHVGDQADLPERP